MLEYERKMIRKELVGNWPSDRKQRERSLPSEESKHEEQIDSTEIVMKFSPRQIPNATPMVTVLKYVCKERILCVDDEPMNLIALKHNLKMALERIRKDICLIDDILD